MCNIRLKEYLVRRDLGLKTLLGCGFFASLLYALPLGHAFRLGPDEGYELLKGFLCSHGFSLYGTLWNDQPPLHTILLATVFKVFGPNIFAARLLAVGFGTVFLVAFYSLVAPHLGRRTALSAVLFLVAAPKFLELCASVMLEVPALGVGLIATHLLFSWRSGFRRRKLFASGLIMGCALQTKFTAGILIPAMLVEIAIAPARRGKIRKGNVISLVGIWFSGLMIAFLTVWVVCHENVSMLWSSHFSLSAETISMGPADYRFTGGELLEHPEAVLGTCLGLALITVNRTWRNMAFPCSLFLTSVGVHLLHRPYWSYYYLHIAVPMAWICGYALATSFNRMQRTTDQKVLGVSTIRLLGTGLFVLLTIAGGARISADLTSLARGPTLESDTFLEKVLQNRQSTRWIYSENNLYPFYAGLPTPPELAVIPLTRRWSGNITESEILNVVREYHPEQLVLTPNTCQAPEWKSFLGRNYTLAYENQWYELFVANEIRRLPSVDPR